MVVAVNSAPINNPGINSEFRNLNPGINRNSIGYRNQREDALRNNNNNNQDWRHNINNNNNFNNRHNRNNNRRNNIENDMLAEFTGY